MERKGEAFIMLDAGEHGAHVTADQEEDSCFLVLVQELVRQVSEVSKPCHGLGRCRFVRCVGDEGGPKDLRQGERRPLSDTPDHEV